MTRPDLEQIAREAARAITPQSLATTKEWDHLCSIILRALERAVAGERSKTAGGKLANIVDALRHCDRCGQGEAQFCDDCLKQALSAEREKVRRLVEQCAGIAELHAERIKHTTHRDGLGMGDQCAEHACLEVARRIRHIDTALAETEEG